MAVYICPFAVLGSYLIRQFGESKVDEKTEKVLANKISIEEATRVVSASIRYCIPIVTTKGVCDIVLASFFGRKLITLFKIL